MVFNDGDFVKVDYNAWRVADNKLVYTTSRKAAEENELLDEEKHYEPQLIVIGKGTTVRGVENAVKSMSLNETKKVELEPKDAFGDKSADLVKVLPISDFKKRDIDPYPGMPLDIDGAMATIKSVNSGRVVVDVNHPLAGEKMLYEIKVVEKLEKDEDKLKAVAAMCSLTPDSVSVSGSTAKVSFGEKVKKDDRDYLIGKGDFLNAAMRYMDKLERITVEEDYAKIKPEDKSKEHDHEGHDHDHEGHSHS